MRDTLFRDATRRLHGRDDVVFARRVDVSVLGVLCNVRQSDTGLLSLVLPAVAFRRRRGFRYVEPQHQVEGCRGDRKPVRVLVCAGGLGPDQASITGSGLLAQNADALPRTRAPHVACPRSRSPQNGKATATSAVWSLGRRALRKLRSAFRY
jgi:hypothetical protein